MAGYSLETVPETTGASDNFKDKEPADYENENVTH
jgi:hypothetical protein